MNAHVVTSMTRKKEMPMIEGSTRLDRIARPTNS